MHNNGEDLSSPIIVPEGYVGIQACLQMDVMTFYGEYIIVPLNNLNINTQYNTSLKPYRNASDACSTCLSIVDYDYKVQITYTGTSA
jgi:hypothetical protein